MITIEQAKLIAKHPQYYHNENLRDAAGLLCRHPDRTTGIRAELEWRAKRLFADIIAEYPELLNCD